jgi:hypothetical protein
LLACIKRSIHTLIHSVSYSVSMCIIIKMMLHMFPKQFLHSRIVYLVNKHDVIKAIYMR